MPSRSTRARSPMGSRSPIQSERRGRRGPGTGDGHRQVDRLVAYISIPASGIDFNEPVLVPVDIRGQPIEAPASRDRPRDVSVQVDVEQSRPRRRSRSPESAGTPAPGFALDAISVEPTTSTSWACRMRSPTSRRSPPSRSASMTPAATRRSRSSSSCRNAVSLADGEEPSVTVTATIGPRCRAARSCSASSARARAPTPVSVGVEQVPSRSAARAKPSRA